MPHPLKAWSAAAREAAAAARHANSASAGGGSDSSTPGVTGRGAGSAFDPTSHLTPAVQARVKQLLAEKQEKGKKKGKGKSAKGAKGKGKAAAAAKEKAKADKAQATAARKEHMQQITLRRLAKGAGKLSVSQQADLEDAGLVDKDGRLTDKGKQLAGKAMTLATKAGARHSASDMQHIQAAHDSTVKAGAMCAPGDGEGEDAAVKMFGDILDDPGDYAAHECQDVCTAAGALTNLMYLVQSELSEEDEDPQDVAQLIAAARILVKFIASELDEADQAAQDDATEDQSDLANEPKPQDVTGKAIGKREDVNPKEGVSQYGDVAFADAKNKKYPIDTEEHIRAAWNYINKGDNAGKYSPDEVATIKKNIVAAWKQKIDKAGPPSAETKGIEFVSLDDGEEIAVLPGYSVKAVGDGWVGGYLVKFGGEGDLSQWRDTFTKSTNYGKHTKTDVWVHHRMLPGLGKRQLKHQADIGMDDEGVFIKHLLNLRDSYEAKLYGLAQQGKLGWSSGTAPHLVERKSLDDGRHEVQQWLLGLDASYTPTPAGGLVVGASAMKSLFADAGVDLLQAIYDNPEAQEPTGERSDATKAQSDRARRLAIELDILALETTT